MYKFLAFIIHYRENQMFPQKAKPDGLNPPPFILRDGSSKANPYKEGS
jgi:hypothetical protein